jgi:hypothetical protein
MSKQSKAKRDKRRKLQPKRPINRLNAQQPVQNHAVLTNEEGQVVAAIGLQGTEWLLAIGGQTMGNADNPVPMLACSSTFPTCRKRKAARSPWNTRPSCSS